MNFEAFSTRMQRERAAIHEAAHAVLGSKIGNGVSRVEIWPGIQEDGTTPDGITTFRDFRSLSREVAIKCLAAGPLAEKRISCAINYQSENDFKDIAKLLRGSGLDFKALIAETESLPD
jgi:hypothetical protein